MTFMHEGIRTRKQEQRGIPETHEVTHECLFIGKNKARDDDLKFGEYYQQGQPRKADLSKQCGNEE